MKNIFSLSLALMIPILCMSALTSACKRPVVMPQRDVDPALVHTVVETPKDRQPSPGKSVVLGNGWYTNVEVDSENRVHFAWTDADRGNVMYAVSPKNKLSPLAIRAVQTQGAVGSHLRLVLGPGDVPFLLYYHQSRKMLRLAYPKDALQKLRDLGIPIIDKVEAAVGALAEVPGLAPQNGEINMAPGWIGEDVAFGEEAGRASAFVIDENGQPHISFYGAKERFRYIRRPLGSAAFGEGVLGAWEKMSVDDKAGGSHTMKSAMHVDTDGSVVLAYAHWNYLDAQVKVALLNKGESTFKVTALEGMKSRVDGWQNTLIKNKDGTLSLYSTATGDQKLYRVIFDKNNPKLGERTVIMDRPGPSASIQRSGETLYVLTRGRGINSVGEIPGVWFITLANENPKTATRLILEKSPAKDAWIDLALRPDGRPVAAWSSRASRSVKVYAP